MDYVCTSFFCPIWTRTFLCIMMNFMHERHMYIDFTEQSWPTKQATLHILAPVCFEILLTQMVIRAAHQLLPHDESRP
jgi:TRAP-type C4-dicarboxylate transport system permease small subunit